MDTTLETLVQLERALATRRDPGLPGGLAALIDDEFFEFGASGRRWDRADVLAMLGEPPEDRLAMSAIECSIVAEDVALLTYTMTSAVRQPILRASLWVRRVDGWRLAFHQGTPQAARASTTPR